MIRPIVPESFYRRIVEVDKELFRQLERMPMRRLLDSGVGEDILRDRISDPADLARILVLLERGLDARGRINGDVLTEDERVELAALLAETLR